MMLIRRKRLRPDCHPFRLNTRPTILHFGARKFADFRV